MTAPLIVIEEVDRGAVAPAGFALWQLGFRPFYLLASVFAALSIGLWAAQVAGWLGHAYLPGPLWHAHEMLFGFVLAVVVGFLFTAGRNWTMRPTPSGTLLAALVALWVAGRVLVLTPFGWASAAANAAFPLAAAAALAVPFWAARSRRNYFFVALLACMGIANLAIHLSALGVIDLPPFLGLRVGLDMMLFIMSVMAGRVIPMFTNNGVPGAGAARHAGVERAALASVLLLLAADAFGLQGAAVAVIAVAGMLAHGLRWALWRPWKTARAPLVWSLHVAYAWIPVHLALRAAAEVGSIGPSAATHALTAGAAGGLIIAMMTRTTRGHTGRPLRADRFDVASFTFVLLAALVRVIVPVAAPAWTVAAIVASAALWSTAFALFAARYGAALIRPRLDGQPG